FGRQFLRPLDDMGGPVEVVQRADVDQIHGERRFTDKLAKFRIHPAAFFVARNVERNRVAPNVIENAGKQGRFMLGQWQLFLLAMRAGMRWSVTKSLQRKKIQVRSEGKPFPQQTL